MKNEINLYVAAKLALSKELYEDLLKAVEDVDVDSLIEYVGGNHKEMSNLALTSVYNGDCDMVVFDQYRKSSDLFDALEVFMMSNVDFVVADCVRGS